MPEVDQVCVDQALRVRGGKIQTLRKDRSHKGQSEASQVKERKCTFYTI